MSEMSVAGCERTNTLRRRCRATVAGVLYATVVTMLVVPNSAHEQAKTRLAVTAFESSGRFA